MIFWQVTLQFLKGFGTTCSIFALTLLFALPLGLIISFGTMSKFKPLKAVMKTIVWVVRGVPLMLQLFIVYYGPSLLFHVPIGDKFVSTIIAFSINYACYFSEIYRAGIEAIPRGQIEAGQVLGMTRFQIFTRITLMQVVKRIVPPMGNEIITLVKDTALARTIVVVEIIHLAHKISNTLAEIWPLFYTAIFYLAFVGILTLLFGWFEKKLSYYKV
ncbi:MAG: amino acid ABC transporter permease [Ruminococcaceae bacterium]|nr:amino acid ABC transporter permease [Oscillospiraceae bacterium]